MHLDAARSLEADPKLGSAYVLRDLTVQNREFKKAEATLLEGLKRRSPIVGCPLRTRALLIYNTGAIDKPSGGSPGEDMPESNPVTHLLVADIYLKQDRKKQAIQSGGLCES